MIKYAELKTGVILYLTGDTWRVINAGGQTGFTYGEAVYGFTENHPAITHIWEE